MKLVLELRLKFKFSPAVLKLPVFLKGSRLNSLLYVFLQKRLELLISFVKPFESAIKDSLVLVLTVDVRISVLLFEFLKLFILGFV